LVVIFLRGAADGLSLVPPLGDTNFTKALRPSIFLPNEGEDKPLALDGFFALHPSFKPIHKFWAQKKLAVIHQVGSPNSTRSHFDAQDYMESGTPGVKATEDGFLSRALKQMGAASAPSTAVSGGTAQGAVAQSLTSQGSSLQVMALQPTLPRLLLGAPGAFALNSIEEFSGQGALMASGLGGGFESLYDSAMDQALKGAGQQSFKAIKTLSALPGNSTDAKYPKSPLGKHLADIARLIKGDVGLKVAVTEAGGWDSHRQQGSTKGSLAKRIDDLSTSLAAFTDDLAGKLNNVCVVTMTEFGRTVKENGTGGTDHGHGSVMMILGGAVKGQQVLADWKNLSTENLYEGRDLPVTTDFREVWAEILRQHLGVKDYAAVFPDYKLKNALSKKLFKS
jgi:uncharacterized protein (DUF1501 family)